MSEENAVAAELQKAFKGTWMAIDDGSVHVGKYNAVEGAKAHAQFKRFAIAHTLEETPEGVTIRTEVNPGTLYMVAHQFNGTMPVTPDASAKEFENIFGGLWIPVYGTGGFSGIVPEKRGEEIMQFLTAAKLPYQSTFLEAEVKENGKVVREAETEIVLTDRIEEIFNHALVHFDEFVTPKPRLVLFDDAGEPTALGRLAKSLTSAAKKQETRVFQEAFIQFGPESTIEGGLDLQLWKPQEETTEPKPRERAIEWKYDSARKLFHVNVTPEQETLLRDKMKIAKISDADIGARPVGNQTKLSLSSEILSNHPGYEQFKQNYIDKEQVRLDHGMSL